MEGLQLQKALASINQELKMLDYLTETPIQIGSGNVETIRNSINVTIELAKQLKENIDNLKFIE